MSRSCKIIQSNVRKMLRKRSYEKAKALLLLKYKRAVAIQNRIVGVWNAVKLIQTRYRKRKRKQYIQQSAVVIQKIQRRRSAVARYMYLRRKKNSACDDDDDEYSKESGGAIDGVRVHNGEHGKKRRVNKFHLLQGQGQGKGKGRRKRTARTARTNFDWEYHRYQIERFNVAANKLQATYR